MSRTDVSSQSLASWMPMWRPVMEQEIPLVGPMRKRQQEHLVSSYGSVASRPLLPPLLPCDLLASTALP